MLARLAHEIVDRVAADARGPLAADPASLAIVGVRTGGAHLAVRLAERIREITGQAPPVGLLDITLYRDDVLLMGNPVPLLKGTDVPFDLEGRAVVLVDDVLFTGRTVRAALEALLELGRPAYVRLAVLVDRGLRELPVAADFVGRALETRREEEREAHGAALAAAMGRSKGAPIDHAGGAPRRERASARVSCRLSSMEQ